MGSSGSFDQELFTNERDIIWKRLLKPEKDATYSIYIE